MTTMTTPVIFTRADYMSGRVDHQTYYAAIAKAAGIGYSNARNLPEIRTALAAGDEHLNTIPLAKWDAIARATAGTIGGALRYFPGESNTLSVGVCVHKAAARAAVADLRNGTE